MLFPNRLRHSSHRVGFSLGAGRCDGSQSRFVEVTSARGNWSPAVDGRREAGQCVYTFETAGYSPAGDSRRFSWLVRYAGGEAGLIFTRLCAGELHS